MRNTTLCLLTKEDDKGKKILLAMKKRGFGEGKWNGVGGGIEDGETSEEAIVRETKEEIGVEIRDFEKVADLTFIFEGGKPDWNQFCHVYLAKIWDGEPGESEEMRPQWYDVSQIPYKTMWPDDRHWLPKILDGKKVVATFTFTGEKGDVLKDIDMKEVQ